MTTVTPQGGLAWCSQVWPPAFPGPSPARLSATACACGPGAPSPPSPPALCSTSPSPPWQTLGVPRGPHFSLPMPQDELPRGSGLWTGIPSGYRGSHLPCPAWTAPFHCSGCPMACPQPSHCSDSLNCLPVRNGIRLMCGLLTHQHRRGRVKGQTRKQHPEAQWQEAQRQGRGASEICPAGLPPGSGCPQAL